MYRHDPADDLIRAARAAVAERDRLVRERDAIVGQLADARDDAPLRGQLAALDRRLAELAGSDALLEDARRAKRQAIAGTPSGAELAAITDELAANRARLPAFDVAIAAGERARAELGSLVAILKTATDEASQESPRYQQLTEAGSRMAGVQAELDAFERALAEVGIPLEVHLATIPEHPTSWWDRIWTPAEQEHAIQMRVVSVLTAMYAVQARVDHLLIRARGQCAAVYRKNAELEQMAAQLVEPT